MKTKSYAAHPFPQHYSMRNAEPPLLAPWKTPTVVVQLVGSRKSGEGRIAVKYKGIFGTVCATSSDARLAAVVCRQTSTSTSSNLGGLPKVSSSIASAPHCPAVQLSAWQML